MGRSWKAVKGMSEVSQTTFTDLAEQVLQDGTLRTEEGQHGKVFELMRDGKVQLAAVTESDGQLHYYTRRSLAARAEA